jgi:uncharacterized repeat protein (TIGR03803 family)
MNAKFVRTRLLGSALILAVSTCGAQAAKFSVLHSFVGGSADGASPLGGVAPAAGGNFYVATDGGGSANLGTLTLLHEDGTTQVLHSFSGGTDGQNADGTPVVWSSFDHNVYGTTQFGGSAGCGTVYKFTPGSGAYQQIYAAECAPEGAFPFAGLTPGESGGHIDLFGAGYNGGSADDGSLFFVTQGGSAGSSCTGSFSSTNGSHPYASITPANGNLYTVATAGGAAGMGTVLEFVGSSCANAVLHNFSGGNDGAAPYGTLLNYNNALYGTTAGGGTTGLGTVFRMNLDGSGYTVLHTFQGICCGNSDGSFPRAGLTLNKTDGQLYGTTINGGNASDNGTVFKIDPSTGSEKAVHAFNGSDGAHPYGALYIKKGKLRATIYGTTVAGGSKNLGVVFKLKT